VKILSAALLILLLCAGCDPFRACQGLSGDDMSLCIARAQAQHQAWQNAAQQFNYNMQQEQNRQQMMMPQPPRPITCQQFGNITQCH
jgi:hypothetical protein